MAMTTTWRWVLSMGATALVFLGMSFLFFMFVLAGYPDDIHFLIFGLLLGLLPALLSSFLAPRPRLSSGIVLCFLGGVLCAIGAPFGLQHPDSKDFHEFLYLCMGVGMGGCIAFGAVTWWFSPKRTKRSTIRVCFLASTLLLAQVCCLLAQHIFWLPSENGWPRELTQVLGQNPPFIKEVNCYDLGGFIDHQWLWRIDAKADAVEVIVKGLGLHITSSVPPEFMSMPPYDWPNELPYNWEAFKSPEFLAGERGSDGEHFFLLHDKGQELAYVWFKSNF